MAKINLLVFTIAFVGSYVGAIPIETVYGVPFEKYGLPNDIERTEIKPEVRTTPKPQIVVKKIVPVTEDTIILSETKPKPVPGKVVAPPNTHIQLRDGKNQYSVGFQSPDGTEVKEQGRLISTDNGWEYVIAKTGSYRYISPEGIPVEVNWIADEKGFRIVPNEK